MALTPAVTAWLKGELGSTVDLVDLDARYQRLGTARAVALEVLRERLADLRAQPANVNVSGVVAVGIAENIKAYERQIAALENGEPPAPDDPVDLDGGSPGGIGMLHLIERPRR
jgi:post-segregation antitoxin (ccd killing protein)